MRLCDINCESNLTYPDLRRAYLSAVYLPTNWSRLPLFDEDVRTTTSPNAQVGQAVAEGEVPSVFRIFRIFPRLRKLDD